MNRNPIIPFVVIMVFGIGLMFLLSFKGLGDAKDLAAEKDGGGAKTEAVAEKPADIYRKNAMPPGLVSEDKAPEMVKWLKTLK